MPGRSGRFRPLTLAVLVALLLSLAPQLSAPATAAPPAAPAQAHTVTYDKYSVRIDDQPVYLWSAEFHYFRLPSPDAWRDVLQKIKAAGFNAVSLYFAWNYHSPAPGRYDFTGVRDVERLLTMAEETGLYVIARPGPYINAEISGGGFPAWRGTRPGVNRTSEPAYLADAREWLSRINPIIARHQLTRGTGSVILYQVENEYQGGRQDADYMETLETWARADGIDVPTFVNDGGANGNWTSGKGAADMYGFDAYPQGFDCRDPQAWRNLPDYSWVRQWVPNTPMMMPEAQGGAFDGWGGHGYGNCRTQTGVDFTRVFTSMSLAAGVTFKNFYMTFGGTNWGWLADPNAGYSSYDYGAPITESRQLTAKYDEFKRLGHFLAAVKPIARTDPATAPSPSDPALRVDRRVNPDGGTQFFFVRHADTRVTATHRTTLTLSGRDGSYPRVPQLGDVAVAGRDAKILVAGYDLGSQRLVYSTSQLMTHARIAARDVAILHGREGESGETVLRYASRPTVRVIAGSITSTWDPARGDLRLNHTHRGQARLLISGGGRPALELIIGDDAEAAKWWRQDTSSGPVLVRGPALVRFARVQGGVLALTGDTAAAGPLEAIAPAGLGMVTWNGALVTTSRVPGPASVQLPALTGWRTQAEAPEAAADFDDASWTVADRLTAVHPTLAGSLPVLAADEYGYHHGDIWYRGRFRATGAETSVALTAMPGNKGVYAAWLNGRYLGSGSDRSTRLDIPAGVLRAGADNVLAVLVENMGHNEEWGHDFSKEPRGLLSASLAGGPTTITWKLQGSTGWDTVRGPFNSGGLYGERAGWSLPGYVDSGWSPARLPDGDRSPGLRWYRTQFDLSLPRTQDTAVALRFDDATEKHYRAHVYLNGWLVGRYINDVGPQREFVLPAGILKRNGRNTLAIARWATDSSGLGAVRLVSQGSVAGGVPIADVPAPGWNAAAHTFPAAAASLAVEAGPYQPAGQEAEVTTGFTAVRAATDVTLSLTAPDGWTVRAAGPVTFPTVPAGQTVTTRWIVTPAAGSPYVLLAGAAAFRQGGRASILRERRAVQVPPPSPAGDHYVSDLPLVRSANGWGPVEVDQSNGEDGAGDGQPLRVDGIAYGKGLGVHAASSVRVWLGGRCSTFRAVVGVDDEVGDTGTVVFTVTGDDRQLARTGTLTGSSAGETLDVDVTGVRWLDLDVTDSGDNNWSDHADWADARLTCAP